MFTRETLWNTAIVFMPQQADYEWRWGEYMEMLQTAIRTFGSMDARRKIKFFDKTTPSNMHWVFPSNIRFRDMKIDAGNKAMMEIASKINMQLPHSSSSYMLTYPDIVSGRAYNTLIWSTHSKDMVVVASMQTLEKLNYCDLNTATALAKENHGTMSTKLGQLWDSTFSNQTKVGFHDNLPTAQFTYESRQLAPRTISVVAEPSAGRFHMTFNHRSNGWTFDLGKIKRPIVVMKPSGSLAVDIYA